MPGPVAAYRGGAWCVCYCREGTKPISKEVYTVQDRRDARKAIDKKIRAA